MRDDRTEQKFPTYTKENYESKEPSHKGTNESQAYVPFVSMIKSQSRPGDNLDDSLIRNERFA